MVSRVFWWIRSVRAIFKKREGAFTMTMLAACKPTMRGTAESSFDSPYHDFFPCSSPSTGELNLSETCNLHRDGTVCGTFDKWVRLNRYLRGLWMLNRWFFGRDNPIWILCLADNVFRTTGTRSKHRTGLKTACGHCFHLGRTIICLLVQIKQIGVRLLGWTSFISRDQWKTSASGLRDFLYSCVYRIETRRSRWAHAPILILSASSL